MVCVEPSNYERMQGQLVDFVWRISDLREAYGRAERLGEPLGYAGIWIEIHRLLIELHEHIAGDAGQGVVTAIMQRLGRAIAALEDLIENDPPDERPALLH